VADSDNPQIILTPEQREHVRRMSGQVVEAIELVPDDTGAKNTGPLRFVWRTSTATGIPRQRWAAEDLDSPPGPEGSIK
jgi:hypothetical protein